MSDPESVANKQTDPAYAGLALAFNFEANGANATTINPAQQPTVDKYLRQTLEEDAGKTNEGVRLALYFQRKAPDITSWYDVLADTALASVVRTALGLPDSFATADIDKQALLFEQKLDLTDSRSSEAHRVPDPLQQHVRDQQPDLDRGVIHQRAFGGRSRRHLHRPDDGQRN